MPTCSWIPNSRKNINLNTSGVEDILEFLCTIYKLILGHGFSNMNLERDDFVSKKINTKLNQQIEVCNSFNCQNHDHDYSQNI